jgi:hypothetical protein
MRKTVEITITLEGRDKGKKFLLTEMSAVQSEAWAWRALNAVVNSGIQVPDDIVAAGWSAVAALGLRGILSADYEAAKPLLAEMMGCIQSVQDVGTRKLVIGTPESDDIEDVPTLLLLRDEVFRLHAGFSLTELLLTFQTPMVTQTEDRT